MKQSDNAKRAEVLARRDHYWNVAENMVRFRRALPQRRAWFTAAALAGKLRPPVLEIGAEWSINAMLLAGELGLATASVDLSRRSLQAADVMARLLDLPAPDPRVAADAERLPFTAGTFGTVVFWGTLQQFADPWPVVAEAWRVLAPDGHAIVAAEPMRSGRWAPLARLGRRKAVAGDVGRHEFAPDEWADLFGRFAGAEWFFVSERDGEPPGASAGRRANDRRAVDWLGGYAYGWMSKTPTVRVLGGERYLVRVDPAYDRMRLRNFTGALRCNGQPMRVEREGQALDLPAEARGQTTMVLEVPRPFARLELWDSDGRANRVVHTLAEEPPSDPLDNLACPDCAAFTLRCIHGDCRDECAAACPVGALDPTDPRLPFAVSCDGCGDCIPACPYGGLDRPRLVEGRCPQCRRLYLKTADVLECRPRDLMERLDLENLERIVRF